MDIRQLEYFVEVARYKSFSKAAESLYISRHQSAELSGIWKVS